MSTRDPDSTRTVWNDLPQDTRFRAVAGFIVHALLVAAAFRSLSKQDAANLRGPEILWKAVIPASIITPQDGYCQGGPAQTAPLLHVRETMAELRLTRSMTFPVSRFGRYS